MPLPNFIIFGAIKSGTGALHQYLSHHPDIFMSPLKEPRFFMFDENKPEHLRKKGKGYPITSLEEYTHQFDRVTHQKAIGEASSNYINSPFAAQKIKRTIPHVRLIASLRNPVDRAYAHYRMSMQGQNTKKQKSFLSSKNEGWVTSSLYYEKLKIYYDLFAADQIKIMIFEEWTNNTADALKEIYQFLGVDEEFKMASHIKYSAGTVTWPGISAHSKLRKLKSYLPIRVLMVLNSIKSRISPKGPQLTSEERENMARWFYDDILKLQNLLQRDLTVWL